MTNERWRLYRRFVGEWHATDRTVDVATAQTREGAELHFAAGSGHRAVLESPTPDFDATRASCAPALGNSHS